MACPFFLPEKLLDPGPLVPPPRLSLVAAHAGTCSVSGITPAEDHQRELCNYGYARGRCPHFPADAPADAVRFSFIAEQQVIYILERDHSPVEWGPVAQASACETPIARQAQTFVNSWLAIRKAERASSAST